jgi:hypothetical protein
VPFTPLSCVCVCLAQSYGYRILMSNEFSDRSFPCPYATTYPAACEQYKGNFVLKSLDIEVNDFLAPWWVGVMMMMISGALVVGMTFEWWS